MLSLILSLLIINANPNAGTAGFNFLKIIPSAKEAAMANATIGLENNSDFSSFGFWFNPAASVIQPAFGISYINYLAGISYGSIGYTKQAPFSFLKSGGIGVSFFNSGVIKRTDINGSELGTFSVSYLNLDAAGNVALMNEKLHAGMAVKVIYGSIDSFMGLGVATDLGLRYKPDVAGLTIGAVVRNLGYQVKAFDEVRDKLPLDIGIGFGYSINNNVNFALDIHKPVDNTVLFNLGAEAWVNKYVALRGGYNSLGKDYRTGGTSDITSGLSIGLGVKYSRYQVDYSFTPMGDLGRLHHITVFFSL
jgi:hypothetical protein